MRVGDFKKLIGGSGTVILELWCLPKLNLSRIDAQSRISFRSVDERYPRGKSLNRFPTQLFL